jgi:ABC-type multidrug transport system permease subunit
MNETRIHHRGRVGQTIIYLGKQLRMFLYQNDWKVLPMSAVIAGLVTFVVGKNLFVSQEGTLMGCFALVCVCIWNGCFNSIQVVCRERGIVKREHRAGLHVSAYILSQMIYQFLLCLGQTLVTLAVCGVAGVHFPASGIITPWGVADIGITILLVTYASDMMALMISCIVRTTTTAMTVMPFLLIFQLVFSGGFFQLAGFAKKITVLTISRWGLDSLCAVGRYNELKMVTLWNTIFKFKDIEFEGTKPLLDVILQIQEQGKVDDILYWSGTYNTNDAYVSTAANVLHNWGAILGLTALFVLAAAIALKFIDKDKR